MGLSRHGAQYRKAQLPLCFRDCSLLLLKIASFPHALADYVLRARYTQGPIHLPGLLLAGLFLVVLLLSIFFASRLHPASRAPVLFRPDTNIQVLLDLKYNLSAEGISCITCSGESAGPQDTGNAAWLRP